MNDYMITAYVDGPAEEIRRIRNAVFTGEQHIDPADDFDGQDRSALHVLVRCRGKYIGTGRVLPDGHIGRVAVLKQYRGGGHGAQIVRALMEACRRLNVHRVYLGAQERASGFYEKLGFTVCGEPYEEVGITHVHMEKFI